MPHRLSIAWKTAAAVAAVLVAVVLVHMLPVGQSFARFQHWVRLQGAAGYVIYAAVYAIAVVLLVPGSVLTIAAGAVFGVAGGTAVVIVGATTGATLAFLLARTTLRQRIRRRIATSARFRAVDDAVAREGAKIVFLIRLAVVFPFTYSNYVLGLTGVRTSRYVLATLIGIAPATLAFVYIGAAAGEAAIAASHVRVGLYAVGAAAALLVSVLIGRMAVREIRRAGIAETPSE